MIKKLQIQSIKFFKEILDFITFKPLKPLSCLEFLIFLIFTCLLAIIFVIFTLITPASLFFVAILFLGLFVIRLCMQRLLDLDLKFINPWVFVIFIFISILLLGFVDLNADFLQKYHLIFIFLKGLIILCFILFCCFVYLFFATDKNFNIFKSPKEKYPFAFAFLFIMGTLLIALNSYDLQKDISWDLEGTLKAYHFEFFIGLAALGLAGILSSNFLSKFFSMLALIGIFILALSYYALFGANLYNTDEINYVLMLFIFAFVFREQGVFSVLIIALWLLNFQLFMNSFIFLLFCMLYLSSFVTLDKKTWYVSVFWAFGIGLLSEMFLTHFQNLDFVYAHHEFKLFWLFFFLTLILATLNAYFLRFRSQLMLVLALLYGIFCVVFFKIEALRIILGEIFLYFFPLAQPQTVTIFFGKENLILFALFFSLNYSNVKFKTLLCVLFFAYMCFSQIYLFEGVQNTGISLVWIIFIFFTFLLSVLLLKFKPLMAFMIIFYAFLQFFDYFEYKISLSITLILTLFVFIGGLKNLKKTYDKYHVFKGAKCQI
ncbi:hypothetical protein [Campylobacter sp. US33a]|uniref:hypothetical protein n=1 Tax=Campylobacter sp. US33a TaxID=2498120 RepID=UPI0010684CBD|nr:hypothetical protein [Campylobacter sp. US33a]TEY04093.1 hypothetical protein ELQ16_02295 [Campylobacter sp. US33a]